MKENLQVYSTFKEFYPFYLSEHQNQICRRLHTMGSILVLLLLSYVLVSQRWTLLLIAPVLGYGLAWVGHFFFEKNKPASFKYPLYSFAGDWVMLWQVVTGKIKF